eukprot:scaffold3541_cov117-Isochrysis_galbana.AAC.4
MSISSYASDLSAASHSHSCEFTQSTPSLQSGMVQPVVNEMFATVHAADSSLLGLFTSCTTFDSTSLKPNLAPSVTRPSLDSAGTRHKHLGTKAIGGTRQGGTYADCGKQATSPDER